MTKVFNEELMKFKITNDKLKMEISLKDLVWLFENSPENYEPEAKIKRGKRKEFAEYVVKMMMDDAPNERDCTRWGEPFEDIFLEISEGYEDEFVKYYDEY